MSFWLFLLRVIFLLLLSLDAHNHADDYSSTLGGVHNNNNNNKKSTFQLWSQVLKLLHFLKFLL